MTNMPVHLINSEQIDFSEQLCEDQKVPYYKVPQNLKLAKNDLSKSFYLR